MSADYEIKGEWVGVDDEHVYSAKAVGKSGRILGKVRLHMAFDVRSDLKQIYGDQGLRAVVESAHEALNTVVQGLEGEGT